MKKHHVSWNEVFRWVSNIDKKNLIVYGVPRGGMILAGFFKKARSTVYPWLADIIIDDIIDSGKTRDHYKKLYPTKPFGAMVDKKTMPAHKKLGWVIFPWEKDSSEEDQEKSVEDVVTRQLQYIGEDVEREGLKGTPDRVIRSWKALYSGYGQDPKEILTTFTEGACDEMVILKDIELYSTCEHHLLPFFGKAHIAYIPRGKVIGISKLARLMEIYSRRLQIQERIGQQVTSALMKYLKPKGAACIIEAQHFCMMSRGVEKQNSKMITSSLTGSFLNKPEARAELMGLIR